MLFAICAGWLFNWDEMKTAIAIVAALLILGLIAWFAVSAARGNNG